MTTRVERIGAATLYLGDCREILPTLGKVDAVVTDPPYGIGMAKRGTIGTAKAAPVRDYGKSDWDDQTPTDQDFITIRALAEWFIIFGGNYFPLPPSSCWLVWDKENTGDFADCELAWTNLPKAVRRIRYMWNGMIRRGDDVREHPTQKPLEVMRWALGHLPEGVRTICDPYMGSGTTGAAAMSLGKQFIGIEREPRYFDIACRRIEEAQRQSDLFIKQPEVA